MKSWQYSLIILLCGIRILMAQERRIQPGDGIEIVVYGHQELSRLVSVSPQGTIDFPFMQNLPVDGLTLEKLREIVVAQLSRYLDSFPVVTLSFARSTTINVNVMGMVKQPGIVQLPIGANLQAAVAAAGGTVPGANNNEVALLRNDNNTIVTTRYDLEKFLLEGDLRLNPILGEGDAVLITGNLSSGSIKVIGEVRSPGAYEEFIGATVFDMLLRAGGTTANANLKQIRFISPSRKKAAEFRINLNQYFAATDSYPMPNVKAGDIIFVPKKNNFWRTAFSITQAASTIMITLLYFNQLRN